MRVLLFDKSFFQSLSADEALQLHVGAYYLSMAPTLVFEILAGLTKVPSKSSPADYVRKLARKLGGSGPVMNESYRHMCAVELLGVATVPMTGQILAGGMTLHRDESGELAGLLDVQPLNMAVMRWSAGVFSPEDCNLALAWRAAARDLSLLRFLAEVRSRNLPLPRPRNRGDDLLRVVDGTTCRSARSSHRPTDCTETLPRCCPVTPASIKGRIGAGHDANAGRSCPWGWALNMYRSRAAASARGGQRTLLTVSQSHSSFVS
jgi:hypothetical protein